jgi:hypothetical protein
MTSETALRSMGWRARGSAIRDKMRRLSVLVWAGLIVPLLLAAAASAPAQENATRNATREALKRPAKRLSAHKRVPGDKERKTKAAAPAFDAAFYVYTLRGSGLEAIEREAREKAMAATIGELYFENRFILAPELLDSYLSSRLDDYVAGLQTLAVRQGVGSIEADVQVAINKRKLESDLAEKRFFYEPRRRPRYHVSLAETIDGQLPQTGVARQEVLASLEDLGGLPSEHEIAVPASNLDVDANQELLYEALVASRRHGVELLLTGAANANLIGVKRLYYDEYAFYTVDITLKLINVQNGKTIRQVSLTGQGSAPDPAEAARQALRRAGRDAAQRLLQGFAEEWRASTLVDEANYTLLIKGIGEGSLNSFLSRLPVALRGLNEEKPLARVKSYVNNVAVVNLRYEGTPERLRGFLHESRYPKFTIDEFDPETGDVKLSILE